MSHPDKQKDLSEKKTMRESLVFSKPYEYTCKCFLYKKPVT